MGTLKSPANQRMNASRNRPAGSLRLTTSTPGRVIRNVMHTTLSTRARVAWLASRVMFGVVALALGFACAGAGHGDYLFCKLLFPIPMLIGLELRGKRGQTRDSGLHPRSEVATLGSASPLNRLDGSSDATFASNSVPRCDLPYPHPGRWTPETLSRRRPL